MADLQSLRSIFSQAVSKAGASGAPLEFDDLPRTAATRLGRIQALLTAERVLVLSNPGDPVVGTDDVSLTGVATVLGVAGLEVTLRISSSDKVTLEVVWPPGLAPQPIGETEARFESLSATIWMKGPRPVPTMTARIALPDGTKFDTQSTNGAVLNGVGTWTLGGANLDAAAIASLGGYPLRALQERVTLDADGSFALEIVASGPDPRVELQWPVSAQWSPWEGVLDVEVDRFGLGLRLPRASTTEPPTFPRGPLALGLRGQISFDGTEVQSSVSVQPVGTGLALEARVSERSTMVGRRLQARQGPAFALTSLIDKTGADLDQLLDSLPTNAADKIRATGFDILFVRIGPGSQELAFGGTGQFLGTPTDGEVGVQLGPGGGLWFRALFSGDPTPVRQVLEDDLGLDLSGSDDLVPDLSLAMREVHIDLRNATFDVGGRIETDDWGVDGRLRLGAPGGVGLELGALYGSEPKDLPTLKTLVAPMRLPTVLGGGSLDFVPPRLAAKLDAVRFIGLAIQVLPAKGPDPAEVELSAQCSFPVGGTERIASFDLSHVGGPDGGTVTTLQIPFLTLDVADMLDGLGIDVDALALESGDVELTLSRITVDTIEKSVRVDLDIDVGDEEALLTAVVGASKIDLELRVGGLVLDVDVDRSSGQTILTGSVRAEAGELTMGKLIAAFGWDGIPKEVDLKLRSATLVFVPKETGFGFSAKLQAFEALELGVGITSLLVDDTAATPAGAAPATPPKVRAYAAAANLAPSQGFSLRDLPLIGPMMPGADTLGIRTLRLGAVSRALTAEDATAIDALFPDNPITLGDGKPMSSGVFFVADVALPRSSLQLQYPPPAEDPQPAPTAAPASLGQSPPAPTAPGPGRTDRPVGTSIGPIRIDELGLSFRDGRVGLAIDAGLELSALQVSVDGLQISTPLDELDLQASIRGLGVSFRAGNLALGGAFVVVDDPDLYERYDGAVRVQYGNYGLDAYGSYARLLAPGSTKDRPRPGATSVFLFGEVTGDFGGPPYLRVRGFSGGFGVNSKVRIPSIDRVESFPFVAGFGPLTDPLEALDYLGGRKALPPLRPHKADPPWVEPDKGDYWAAAGVKLSTFELLITRALLTVAFGDRLEVALMGVSRLELPRQSDSGGAVRPTVSVELDVLIRVVPEDGILQVAAQLGSASYVLTPECRLTGGFAIYSWFKDLPKALGSPRAGDFVVTLGGYSPKFAKPAHYPSVPRLGLSWRPGYGIVVKGGVYFALTPAMVMAGGSLDATYKKGPLEAWFKAWADFVMAYRPFHYEATVGLRVGASVRINLGFFKKTFKTELSASLELAGPELHGKAKVRWTVFEFTVEFGTTPKPDKRLIGWGEFVSGFLPQLDDTQTSRLRLQIAEGARPSPKTGPAIVDPTHLVIAASSPAPVHDVVVRVDGKESASGMQPGSFGTRPMGDDIESSEMIIEVTRSGGSTHPFQLVGPIQDGLASAVWGRAGSNETTLPAMLGATLRPVGQDALRWIGPFSLSQLLVRNEDPKEVVLTGYERDADERPATADDLVSSYEQGAEARARLIADLQASGLSNNLGDVETDGASPSDLTLREQPHSFDLAIS